jgi:hypothetical protein
VLFPVNLGRPADGMTVDIPAGGLERVLVTGLEPGAGYSVSRQHDGDRLRVSVAKGGEAAADEGGVLVVAGDAP